MQQGNSNTEIREDSVQAGEDYKSSLKVLLALYENDVRKLTEHSEKCKELYAEGVISRREYETTTGDVTEAQVKVDEMRKQIDRGVNDCPGRATAATGCRPSRCNFVDHWQLRN